MRWLLLLGCPLVYSQTFDAEPTAVKQGEIVHLRAPASAQSARLNGRTIRLFPDPSGAQSGLMPIPVEEKPGGYTLDFLDASGAVQQSSPITVLDARYPIQNIVIAKATSELKPSPGESESSDAFRHLVSPTRYWNEPFALPVPGCMTSPFGVRRFHNGKPTGDYHAGFDQGSPAGTPIHAIADGEVKIVKSWNLHGNTVGIDHGQGLASMYLHMSKFNTSEGAQVKKGDVIGYVGATGRANGPHLHWSLYVNSVPVNPGLFVRVPVCAPARPASPRRKKAAAKKTG